MIQSFTWPGAEDLLIKVLRLDANDALISGNKFYKLKPWLKKAQVQHAALMSCGGAYSNHLHALAAAGQQYGIQTYALVRGMEPGHLTVTLDDCQRMGMQLIAVSREQYAKRYEPDFARPWLDQMQQKTLWVPEGGTDEDAVTACEAIGLELNRALHTETFDSVWLAVGSGGTLAGVARSLQPGMPLYAVPVMKHWQDVRQRVNHFLDAEQAQRIRWLDGGDYGGFGRNNEQQLAFMARLERQSGMTFDPVYTSKLVRRLLEFAEEGQMTGNHPLVIHTGGLQGRRSVAGRLGETAAV